MKPIDIDSYIMIAEKPDPGAVPMMQWVKIANLVIDESYQREIRSTGRKSVRKIALGFRWSKFAPIIVSPVAGGRYAIVDGQHRATAAALLKFDEVPCQVIIASQAEQAAAFHAINGTTTRMTAMQMHAAALVAGDADALAVADVCARAQVEILRYPLSVDKQKPGQTHCVETIAQCLRTFGADVVVTGLQCVTQTANREVVGLLRSAVVRGLCVMLAGAPEYLNAGEKLLDAFDDIDIEHEHDEARSQKKRAGETTATVFADRLRKHLAAALKAA